MSALEDLEKALREWMGEMEYTRKRLADGTPMMGKFETEQVYRAAKAYFDFAWPKDFKWVNRPVTVRGEDFTYEATCLCSFPKSNGKVRYIVEDNGRLFIQRWDQLDVDSRATVDGTLTVVRRDVPDIHTERAERESIPRPEAKLKNYQDAFGITPKVMGCPKCGYSHPPDGVCLEPLEIKEAFGVPMPVLDEIKKVVLEAWEKYGDDDSHTCDRIRRHEMWNDHVAVQAGVAVYKHFCKDKF